MRLKASLETTILISLLALMLLLATDENVPVFSILSKPTYRFHSEISYLKFCIGTRLSLIASIVV